MITSMHRRDLRATQKALKESSSMNGSRLGELSPGLSTTYTYPEKRLCIHTINQKTVYLRLWKRTMACLVSKNRFR